MTVINSPIGEIHLHFELDSLKKVELFKPISPKVNTTALSVIQRSISEQFVDYFEEAHAHWRIELISKGTVFQHKVWAYLKTIPLGETRYYSDIALALSSSAQAVGNACRANPFPIIVPCHRVISHSGVGGFAGKTTGRQVMAKQWLLDHEQR